MPMFNELVIKKVLIEKLRSFFVFMEDIHLPQSQVSLREGKMFRYKFLGNLYRNNELNFLVNFNLILSALKISKGKSKLTEKSLMLF